MTDVALGASSRASIQERRDAELAWYEVRGDGWRVGFSTRLGGVSQGPHATLNIGYSVADQQRAVAENRRRFAAALGVEVRDLVVPGQVHGTTLASVGLAERGRGAFGRETVVHDTDGLLTGAAGVPLMVTFADCVPVLIVARGASGAARIALVHAGWRGMLAGIVAKAVRELTSSPARLEAAVVGPSIGPCSFSVGEDVGRRFEAAFPGSWQEGRVDLWRAAEQQLTAAGLAAREVVNPWLCTVCDQRFFSHRRDKGCTGRQAAIAWLE
ncbi:MAG TPA: polyphenol oxidase family protein [Thermoleophilia bacterium]|nr:polyphenol oxidase family protein [Thermoleophilia bacterium]